MAMATITPMPADALIEMSKAINPEPSTVLHRPLVIAEPKTATLAAAAVLAPHLPSPLLTLDTTSGNAHVGNLVRTSTLNPTALPATGILTVNRCIPIISHIAIPAVKKAKPIKRRNRCPHNRRKRLCKECGGSAYCKHGRQKHRCKDCGTFCKHGRNKYCCKECGGASFCKHGRRKQYCKLCGGATNALCKHNKRKSRCKICGGSAYCEHGKRKDGCRICNPKAFCVHGRLKRRCKECGGSSQCWHGRYRHLCKDCNSGPKKRGPPKNSKKSTKKTKSEISQPKTQPTATVVTFAGPKAVAAVANAIPAVVGQAASVRTHIASTTTLSPAPPIVTPQILGAIATTTMPSIIPITPAANIAVALDVTTAVGNMASSQLHKSINV